VTTVDQERLEKEAQTTNRLDVTAHGTIREGKLEGFKRQAAELIRQTKEKDTKTLRYDWFISTDGTEFEVLEAYVNSEDLMEHSMHIGEARNLLFSEFASDHRITVPGDPSAQLVELVNTHAPGGQGVSSGIPSSRDLSLELVVLHPEPRRMHSRVGAVACPPKRLRLCNAVFLRSSSARGSWR
jgi:quinol monooxygenase YgiN